SYDIYHFQLLFLPCRPILSFDEIVYKRTIVDSLCHLLNKHSSPLFSFIIYHLYFLLFPFLPFVLSSPTRVIHHFPLRSRQKNFHFLLLLALHFLLFLSVLLPPPLFFPLPFPFDIHRFPARFLLILPLVLIHLNFDPFLRLL